MYELIVVGKVEGADTLFTKVEKLIKDANASSVSVQKMGKKVLAYPIKKQTEAEYFLFNFEAPGESILDITQGLRLEQEQVLRYMMLRTAEGRGKVVSGKSAVEKVEGVEAKAKPVLKSAARKIVVKSKTKVDTKKVKSTKLGKAKKGKS